MSCSDPTCPIKTVHRHPEVVSDRHIIDSLIRAAIPPDFDCRQLADSLELLMAAARENRAVFINESPEGAATLIVAGEASELRDAAMAAFLALGDYAPAADEPALADAYWKCATALQRIGAVGKPK